MRHLRTITLLLIAIAAIGANAQVTTSPALLQMSSKEVTIYFHADQGNKALAGQPSTADIYAHTGVIPEGLSNQTTTSDWLDNSPKYKLEYAGPDLWALRIGNIASFYGFDADTKVAQLAFRFRNADGSLIGMAEDGKDIRIEILPEGFHIRLTASPGGTIISPENSEITFTAATTQPAAIAITINRVIIATAEYASSLSTTYSFNRPGSYTVEAKAASTDAMAETSLSLMYAKEPERRDYPGGKPKQGAQRAADGSVLFCLAAPQKKSAIIVGAWDNYDVLPDRTMFYQDYEGQRYFWIAVEGLKRDVAYPYYYLVDNTLCIGDPYAMLVLDPEFDPDISGSVFPDIPKYPAEKVVDVCLAVYREDLNDYNWKSSNFKAPDPGTLNIYEILLRDFTGTEGEAYGNGTVKAAIGKIPYLKKLGINAVELMPICEFDGNTSWGYTPNSYFAPDKAYGTPDDYKRFIDACHSEGIAVVLDMAFDQAGRKHPWLALYPAESNPFFNTTADNAPNEWRYDNPLVQQQWDDAIRYWLTNYKVDGFRFEFARGSDNTTAPGSYAEAHATHANRMMRFAEVAHGINPDAYIICGDRVGPEEGNKMAEAGVLGWVSLNMQGCRYAAGHKADSGLRGFYAPSGARTWDSTVSFLQSHNDLSPAYFQATDGDAGLHDNVPMSMRRLGATAAQMIMAPGAHMMWQFSELGDEQQSTAGSSNDSKPGTVCWNYLDDPDRRGLYDNYAELFAIRARYPQLFASGVEPASNTADNFWTGGRTIVLTKGNDQLIMAANPIVDASLTIATTFASSNSSDYEIVSKSYNTEPTFDASTGTITLEPNAYVVLARKSSSGISSHDPHAAVRLFAKGEYGALTLASTESGVDNIDIFSTTGTIIKHIDRLEGIKSLEVPAGIYIVRTVDQAYKVIVR